MTKEWLCLFVGDTHVLSHTGLALPGYPIESHDNTPYHASPRQRWLYECWKDLEEKTRELSKSYYIALMFGGDGIDGPGHHHTRQTYGNRRDAVTMAVELLRPFANIASAHFGLTGTDAHVDEGGEQDKNIAGELGLKVQDVWELDFDGRRLWWAHEGVKMGARRSTIDNGMIALAKDIDDVCNADPGRARPELVVGHHVHRSPEPVTVRGITVATVGCWQLPTMWALQKFPFKSVDVGAMFWHPASHKVHRHLYRQYRQPLIVQKPIKAYDTPKR